MRTHPLRHLARGLGLFLLATALVSGCSGKPAAPEPDLPKLPLPITEKAKTYTPAKLTLGLVAPAALRDQTEVIHAQRGMLAAWLEQRLGIPASVKLASTEQDLIDALTATDIDLALLSPRSYVAAHDEAKAAEALLQRLSQPFDFSSGQASGITSTSHRSLLVVRSHSPIRQISDLKGRMVGWQHAASLEGRIWPVIELKKGGFDPQDNTLDLHVKGEQAALRALLDNQVDAIAISEETMVSFAAKFPASYQQLRILMLTVPIPNEVIAVRSDMEASWHDKLIQAFTAMNQTDPSEPVPTFELLPYAGFAPSNDAAFDLVRMYMSP